MKSFLIVHLVSNGDCLMATTLAQQVKHDNPDCHITWAISYKCKQVIENNPYVDSIWEIVYKNDESPYGVIWEKVKSEAEKRKINGEFDEIIYSQIYPDYPFHFDGTTRSSIFRAYSLPISVPVKPIIRLYENEVERVKQFALKNNLTSYKNILLCECAPSSGQSFLTPDLMLTIGEKITKKQKDLIFIISSHIKIVTQNTRIIDASELTYRENAELSKYCTLFIGCSSGITWLLTSDWAKKIPTIQFLINSKIPFSFASVKYDFKFWKLSHDHILETTQHLPDMIDTIIVDSIECFENAKRKYGEQLFPSFKMLYNHLQRFNLSKFCHSLNNSFLTIRYFSKRNKYNYIISSLMPIILIWVILNNVFMKAFKILFRN